MVGCSLVSSLLTRCLEPPALMDSANRGPFCFADYDVLDGCLPYRLCSWLPRAPLELREILSTTAVQRLQSLCPG